MSSLSFYIILFYSWVMFLFFCVFKQKTAYEMGISDWSSDVCSSDLRKISKAERAQRIDEVLGLVEMSDYGARYPHALSGGQQQRVALARTLVYRPSLLLLDEPLSNLDAKLRERARTWLRHLQSRVGVTTVYVTHDQSEALALSDRIAVMNAGKNVQLAEPWTLYARPLAPFGAHLIAPRTFFPGQALEDAASLGPGAAPRF